MMLLYTLLIVWMVFGLSFDEFLNKGGMDMSDDKIEEVFLKDKKQENKTKEDKAEVDHNYFSFYKSKEDEIKLRNIENRLNHLDEKLKKEYINTNQQINEAKYNMEKDIDLIEQKLFSQFNTKENIYDFVKYEQDFSNKKQKLLNEKFDNIEDIANDYYFNKSLSYKLKSKAKYIMGVNRNLYNDFSNSIS